MLILGLFFLNGALVVGSQPKGGGSPENITVQIIDSKTVEVFWSTALKNVERYDISYNPTENRVVSQAAGNSHSIILRELRPNTQYQVTVTAVVGGKNYKSRRLVFRTLSSPDDPLDLEEIQPSPTKPTKIRKPYPVTPEIVNPDPTAIGSKYTPQTSTTVRGVEIGLVLLALVVWIIAIALFFHRWGKIRMLLPYQPDYKTQQSLKVPGTGTTIVSGCTGNNSSQGHQDGPGCVQHVRWSNRLFEESSTAKKCSPTKKPPRPRVSSAIFPASPSFCYARTLAECDSPRIIRHAHSHSEFPTETIPLCQVNQPRSESPQNVITITVPVIASNVNEKAQNKKNRDSKVSEQIKNLDDFAITSENPKKDKEDANFLSTVANGCADDEDGDDDEDDEDDNDISRRTLLKRHSHSFYQKTPSPRIKEKENCPSELEPLFFTEYNDSQLQTPSPEKFSPTSERPRRYNRSSLKKQKHRFYDDRDYNPCNDVPIYESGFNSQEKNQKLQESEPEKPRKPKNLKTEEMRRKTFLRKVSLQDTYLNYNQDYWLDFKKSRRFYKSIDLGYFGSEEKGNNKTETQGFKKASDVQGPNLISGDQFAQPIAPSNQIQPSAIKSQSKLPLTYMCEGGLKRSDSDPVIFPSKCTCESCRLSDLERGRYDFDEETVGTITKADGRELEDAKRSWLFLPSNENIPLFFERNGFIETDFDVFNDELYEDGYLGRRSPKNDDIFHKVFCIRETESGESDPKGFESSIDYSSFYEIKLTHDSESENENLKMSGEGF